MVLNRDAAERAAFIKDPVQLAMTKSQQPTGKWSRLRLTKTKSDKAVQCFIDMIVRQIKKIKETGR